MLEKMKHTTTMGNIQNHSKDISGNKPLSARNNFIYIGTSNRKFIDHILKEY